MTTVYRACVIKLYPSDKQRGLLKRQLGIARWVYNHFLSLRIRHYKIYGKHKEYKAANAYRLSGHLTKLKTRPKYEFLKAGSSWSLQFKLEDMHKAFIGLWKHKRGFPRFKSVRHPNHKMRYDKTRFSILDNKHIKISKLGVMEYRGNLLEGKIVSATISQRVFGRVELSVLYEQEEVTRVPKGFIALDINCHNVTDNHGIKYNMASYYHQDKIRKWSKTLARRIKGSNNWHKAREQLAKWHYRAGRMRLDRAHKITYKIAMRSETQAMHAILEDINLQNITRKGKHKRGLNRSLLDSSLGAIRQQLEYKCAGVSKIDRFYPSSKLCSECGVKNNDLLLSDRQWQCGSCGTLHDRDINAAKNIINKWLGDSQCGDDVRPILLFANDANVCEARMWKSH